MTPWVQLDWERWTRYAQGNHKPLLWTRPQHRLCPRLLIPCGAAAERLPSSSFERQTDRLCSSRCWMWDHTALQMREAHLSPLLLLRESLLYNIEQKRDVPRPVYARADVWEMFASQSSFVKIG